MCLVGIPATHKPSVFWRLFCVFGWHIPVRSRPFSLFCVFGWHLPVRSRAFSRGCFVCSVGTFLSEAVRFLGVVLCVRLAPFSQKPSKAVRFLGVVLCVRLAPSCQKPSVFSRLFWVFGWHLPVRSRPFSLVCFVCSAGTFYSSRPFHHVCFVCLFGTVLSKAVRFLGFVLCVRLAPSCQKPSVFSGLFCVFGWHLPVRSRPFSRVCFVCPVGAFRVRSRPFSLACFVCSVGTLGQKPSVFSGLFCVFGWHLPVRSRPFSRCCFVSSVGTYLACQKPSFFSGLFCVFGWHFPFKSCPFSQVRIVCSAGTFHSKAVHFLRVVLCVRLALCS